LLITGNEVEQRTARNGIKRAELLAFHYEKDLLAGIAAIKRPTEDYENLVFRKSKTDMLSEDYRLELGYAVTRENFRGHGICSNLVKQLLQRVPKNLYATTRSENTLMQRILDRNGFKKTGSPYKGKLKRKEYFLQLSIRKQ